MQSSPLQGSTCGRSSGCRTPAAGGCPSSRGPAAQCRRACGSSCRLTTGVNHTVITTVNMHEIQQAAADLHGAMSARLWEEVQADDRCDSLHTLNFLEPCGMDRQGALQGASATAVRRRMQRNELQRTCVGAQVVECAVPDATSGRAGTTWLVFCLKNTSELPGSERVRQEICRSSAPL